MRAAGIQRLQFMPGGGQRQQADPRKLLRHLYQLFGRARLQCRQSLPRRLHLPLSDGLYGERRPDEIRRACGAAGSGAQFDARVRATTASAFASPSSARRCRTAPGSAATAAMATAAASASRPTSSSSSRPTGIAFRPRPRRRPGGDGAARSSARRCGGAADLPVAGEMSGRTEGGAVERQRMRSLRGCADNLPRLRAVITVRSALPPQADLRSTRSAL